MGISLTALSERAQKQVIRKLKDEAEGAPKTAKEKVTLLKPLRYVIEGDPATKKNSQQIAINPTTGKQFVAQSKRYKEYENCAAVYLRPRPEKPINSPVRLKVVYYRRTRRRVDLANLLSATCDILVRYQIIADDCVDIVKDHDGTRVRYDKERPRAEIEIIPVEAEDG